MNDFIQQINNDDEALAILSSFGFTMRDWPFISKMTSPQEVMTSDLMGRFFAHKIAETQIFTGCLIPLGRKWTSYTIPAVS